MTTVSYNIDNPFTVGVGKASGRKVVFRFQQFIKPESLIDLIGLLIDRLEDRPDSSVCLLSAVLYD